MSKYCNPRRCDGYRRACILLLHETRYYHHPQQVTTIEASAFRSCTALTAINIPAGVTSIGAYAFEECTSLTSVTVNAETPITITSDVFSNRANATLYVPYGTKSQYRTTADWSSFSNMWKCPIRTM